MPNIDERVVQMRFDNKQFEQGVAESLKTLDKLKEQLKLEDASKSLINLNKVVSDLDFNSLENDVTRISNAFTPLGKIAQKTLDQIADKAVNTGKQLVGMLTGFNDMVAGKAKYEMETKAVQTITNATGKSVQEVEGVLSKLMHYTDETSYDFAQMASSIGKFTSVGVDLEIAEEAMEGIANWAAKSGADKQMANRAMYNISQAMGAGSMMVRDWMSIENANMATQEFKETAIETAKELGRLQDAGEGAGKMIMGSGNKMKEIDVDYQSFRETLRYGWLDTEVLTETLRKYGDQTTQFGLDAYHAAQNALTFTDAIDAVKDSVSSGWMKTMQLLFGNLDEAREFWTNLATWMQEFAGVFSEARNHLLEGWHDLGGYSAMIESITNVWRTFENVVLGVREAIQQVFPPETAEHLVELTEKVRDGTAAFRKMFAIDRWDDVEEIVEKTVDHAEKLSSVLKEGDVGDDVTELEEALRAAGYLVGESETEGIYNSDVKAAIEKLQKDLKVKVTGQWDETTRKAAMAEKTLVSMGKDTEEVYKQTDFLSKGMSRIQEIVQGISGVLKIVLTILKGGLDIAVNFISIFSPIIDLLGRVGAMFGMMFKNLSDDIKKGGAIAEFVETLTFVFEPLAKAIETVTQFFHDFINTYAEALRQTNRRNTFGNFFTFLVNYLKKDTILAPVIEIGQMVIGTIARIAGTIVGTVMDVASMVGGFISDLFGLANNEDGSKSGFAVFLETIAQIAYVAAQVLGQVVGVARQVVTTLVSGLLAFAGPAIETVAAIVLSLIQELIANLPTILPMIMKVAPIILAIITAITLLNRTKGPISGFRMSMLSIVGVLAFFVAASNKDKIIGFFKGLYSVVKDLPATQKLVDLFGSLIEKLKALFTFDPNLGIFGNIQAVFKKISTFILKKLKEIGARFITIFAPQTQEDKDLGFFGRIKDRLSGFVSWLKAIGQSIIMIWNSIMDALLGKDREKFDWGEGSILERAFNGIRKLFESVVKMARDILESDYLGTILSGIFVVGFYKLGRGISKLSDNMGNIISVIKGNTIDKKDTFGTTALKFAGAVAIISGAMLLLSRIKFEQTDGVINGLTAFETVLITTGIVLGVMQVLNNKFPNKSKNGGFTRQILELTSTIAILGAGLLLVQKFLSGGHVAGSLVLITVVLGALIGIKYLMDKFGNGKSSNTKGIYEMCKGLLAVVGAIALASLTMLVFGNNVWKGLALISIVLAELAIVGIGLASASGAFGKNGKTDTSIKGILGLCAGVYVVVLAIGRMTKVMDKALKGGKDAWSVGLAMASVIGIVALLGAFAVAIVKASRVGKGGKSHVKASIVVLGVIIAGVVLIADSLRRLMKAVSASRANDGDMYGAIASIVSIIAIIAGMGAVFKMVADSSTNLDGKKLAGVTIAFGVMAAAITGITYVLTEGIAKLKGVNPQSVIATVLGIAGIVAVMSLLINSMVSMKADAGTGINVGIALAAIMSGIAAGIWVLVQLGASAVDTAASAIWHMGSSLSDFASMTSDIDWSKIERVVTFFEDDLVRIVGSLLDMYNDLGTAVNATSKLMRIGERLRLYTNLISGGPQSAEEINSKAIAIVEGAKKVAEIASNISVPQSVINADLISLGVELLMYSSSLTGIDTSGQQNAVDIANNAKEISDIINTISIADGMNTTLVEFGEAIQLYYAAISGVGLDENGNPIKTNTDPIDSEQLQSVMQGIVNAIDLDTVKEVATYAEGQEHDLTQFALGIAAIGDALKIYGEKINGLNSEEIASANSVLTTVGDIYTKLNASNLTEDVNYINELSADKKLTQFAKGIAALGAGLGIYKDKIGGIDPTDVETANGVLDKVTDLDKYLNSKNTGTFIDVNQMSSDLADESAIETFATQLTALGGGISDYCASTKDVTDAQIASAQRVLTFVSNLQYMLPKTGSAIAKFFEGEVSLNNFSEGLGALGNGLYKFKTNLQGVVITEDDIRAVEGVKLIGEAIGHIGNTGGLTQLIKGEFSWDKIMNQFENVPQHLKAFQDSLIEWEFQPAAIEDSLVAMERLGEFLGKAQEIYNSANDGMSGNVFETLANGIEELFLRLSNDYLSDYVQAQIENVELFGNSIMTALSLGLSEQTAEDGLNLFASALRDIVDDGIEKLKGRFDDFKDVGTYLCEGMAVGIHDELDRIIEAAQAMDEALIGTVEEETEVHSPSRKFEWIAQMCAIGLANGFDKYSYLVTDAANTIASGSIDTIMAAFKEDQLKNVGFGALAAVRELLINGNKNTPYTEKELNIVKQLLVQSKYLSAENVDNIDAVKEAMAAFKQEVLGVEAATGDNWGFQDSVLLWNRMYDSLYKDGKNGYDQLSYESDMMKQLGIDTANATDKMTEANERLLDSVESLADMYETLNAEQKQIVEESVDPDWMTEMLYWTNVGEDLVKKYGEYENPLYDRYNGNKDLINYDSEWNSRYFENIMGGGLEQFTSGLTGEGGLLGSILGDGSSLLGMLDLNGTFVSGLKDKAMTFLFGEGGAGGVLSELGSKLFAENGPLAKAKDKIVGWFGGEDGIIAKIGKMFSESDPIDIPFNPVVDMSTLTGEDGGLNVDGQYGVTLEAKNLTADFSTDAANIINSASTDTVNKLLELKQALLDSGTASKSAIEAVDRKLASISSDMKTMNVYLDGNKLVGYITPKINRTLGVHYIEVQRMQK